MKRTFLHFAVILVTVFIQFSCKTLKTERPVESYLPSQLTPAVSELPLQIEIDIKKLESAVNREFTGLLFEGDNLNNQDLSVKVWKAQDFAFNINNNSIQYRVPLKLWSRFAWSVERFGVRIGDKYEANGSLALNFNTTVDIDKNWKLVAKTGNTGFQWIETPKVNVLGVSVPVTPIANYALQRSQQMIGTQIDQTLSQMVELRKYANMAWQEMQKPMLMSPENQLWLRLTPKTVQVTPFESKGQKLILTVTLQALVESFMGSKPEAPKPVALPAFSMVNRKPGDFNINIAADATFAKITELARTQLINKTFTEGKNSITITGLNIFGSAGKVVFEVDVTGSLKGKLYLMGDMVYNPQKMTVEVQNPEFDVKTKNALVSSANWLLNGLIIKKMTPYLNYPVKAELDMMKAEANKTLSNYEVYEGVSLTGKLTTLDVQRLDIVPGAVRINANLRGNVGLKVNDLKW